MDNKSLELPNSQKDIQFLENLVKKLQDNALASVIFSDPVRQDGLTVIPVGKVGWGFAGGSTADKKGFSGSGAGGGIGVSPVGYIEIKNGRASFKPIFDSSRLFPLVIGLWLVILFFAWRFTRKKKKAAPTLARPETQNPVNLETPEATAQLPGNFETPADVEAEEIEILDQEKYQTDPESF